MTYIFNTETEEMFDVENPGIEYVESGGTFPDPEIHWRAPWREATQAEIDACELVGAKVTKMTEMKDAYQDFVALGFVYDNSTFCLTDDGISNVTWKDMLDLGDPDRLKFCTLSGEPHTFSSALAFTIFKKALIGENERIMFKKYNPYKAQINACETIAEVEAITIDFSAD